MEESQGEERGLDMTPCSLANAQRPLWGRGGDLDWRKKLRSERSDSWQMKKNDRTLKRKEGTLSANLKKCKRRSKWRNIANHTPDPLTPQHTLSFGDLGGTPSGEGFVSDSGGALAKVLLAAGLVSPPS